MLSRIFYTTFLLSFLIATKAQDNKIYVSKGRFISSGIKFQGNLYFRYECTNDSGYFYQLAKYDGDKVEFIPNPDSGRGIEEDIVLFNNNLIFGYKNKEKKNQLAKFDGHKITLVNTPDSLTLLFLNTSSIFKNKIYFSVITKSFIWQVFFYDGNKIGNIDYSDSLHIKATFPEIISCNGKAFIRYMDSTNSTNLAMLVNDKIVYKKNFPSYVVNPILYHNKIYYTYFNTDWIKNSGSSNKEKMKALQDYSLPQLACFDGENISFIKNPETEEIINIGAGFCIYRDAIYFEYTKYTGGLNTSVAKYDGTEIKILEDNSSKEGYYAFSPIKFHECLYWSFQQKDAKHYLIRYDGIQLTYIENPDTDGIGYLHSVEYNNQLFFLCSQHEKESLAYLKEDKIIKVQNPDTGTGIHVTPTLFKGCLVFTYQNKDAGYQLAKYDGQKIILINDPNMEEWKCPTPVIELIKQ